MTIRGETDDWRERHSKRACLDHNVAILTGDWNMALWLVQPTLAALEVPVKIAAFYAWNKKGSLPATIDEAGEDDGTTQAPAAAAQSADV